MKLLAQVVAVDALALIVSLPGQLFAHVPITQISQQLTTRLESMEEDDTVESELDEGLSEKAHVPDLLDLFRTMQWVRGVVTAVHAPGSTDISGIGKTRDDRAKVARRVELSLIPGAVNAGVRKADLCPGFVRGFVLSSSLAHGLRMFSVGRLCQLQSKV
jgi:rRNA biogenesis protein RRP5